MTFGLVANRRFAGSPASGGQAHQSASGGQNDKSPTRRLPALNQYGTGPVGRQGRRVLVTFCSTAKSNNTH